MKVFRQVVESGSVAAAAERLRLSTVMVSKHLVHLEKHLGGGLVNRDRRSLSLTELGKRYFERCKVILEEMAEAELAVGSVSGAPRGVLRVTAPSWTETRPLMDMVATHRQRYPDVVVDISFEDRLVDLAAEGYDLAIRATSDPPSAGLVARPLRPMPFVIAASREYVQRCGVPRSPEELAQHDCVMIGDGHSWHLTGPNGNIAVPARVVLRFGTMTIAAAHAVCTGIGLAALPHIILEDPMFKDVLRPVLVTHPARNSHLYAIYASRQQTSLKIRTFIEHVVEHTQIPYSWDDLSGVGAKHSNHGMPVVTLFPT